MNRQNKQLIPFTEKDIKAYLDRSISYWYKDKENEFAEYYIDAFQSVRKTLFGSDLETCRNCGRNWLEHETILPNGEIGCDCYLEEAENVPSTI